MIEEVGADLFGRIEEFLGLPFVVCCQTGLCVEAASQPHATKGEAGYFQIGVRNFDLFHSFTLLGSCVYQA